MNTDWSTLYKSAYDHLAVGRYEEAIQKHQSALRLNPEGFIAHYNLHFAYRDTNQLQLALQELQEAARLSPDDSGVYDSRAYLYDVLALSKNAPALQEIITQLPSDAKDREILLGQQAVQQKDYPQALTHFENALREQPDVPYIQGYVGRTLIHLRRNAEAQQILTVVAKDKKGKIHGTL